MTFLNPYALLSIPIVLWIFKNIFLPQDSERHELFQEHKRYTSQAKMLLFTLLLALIALGRPAITNEISKEKFEANEYIIAIDASFSMQMNDIKPSRYIIAKQTIISLLHLDVKDRFTLFAFTKNPLLISPPTTDHEIVISALNALEPEFILTKSTSLLSLLEQVSKLDQEHKSLIIFTDGGDEHNLNQLEHIASKNTIIINIVAIASQKGSIIKKNLQPLKDENAHLIISRINPILKNLAKDSGGFYLKINVDKRNLAQDIYSMMQKQHSDKEVLSSDVVSYKELYFIPLLGAIVIFLLALTKLQKYFTFLVLTLYISPNFDAKASLLDFHYNKLAKKASEEKKYTLAIENYKKLTPTQYSYISIANAYYRDKQYKNALHYYSQIKSKDKGVKSILYYNMGNAAFRLKKYSRAKEFYKQSLSLQYTKEAYENLTTLYKLNLQSKINVADTLPHVNDKKVKNITKKNESKKEDKESDSSSNSQQKASQGSQGGKGSKSKKESQQSKSLKSEKNKFKMGYNAYELINKGYVHEKEPW